MREKYSFKPRVLHDFYTPRVEWPYIQWQPMKESYNSNVHFLLLIWLLTSHSPPKCIHNFLYLAYQTGKSADLTVIGNPVFTLSGWLLSYPYNVMELGSKRCIPFNLSSAITVSWLVVLRINVDLAIFQPYLDLEAGDNQSLKIQVARPGIEPRSSCYAIQELNHWATAAPIITVSTTSHIKLDSQNVRKSFLFFLSVASTVLECVRTQVLMTSLHGIKWLLPKQ